MTRSTFDGSDKGWVELNAILIGLITSALDGRRFYCWRCEQWTTQPGPWCPLYLAEPLTSPCKWDELVDQLWATFGGALRPASDPW